MCYRIIYSNILIRPKQEGYLTAMTVKTVKDHDGQYARQYFSEGI